MAAPELFVLRTETRTDLENAFGFVNDHPDVASCVVEPGQLQIRFQAPAGTAQRLIERVYLEGGLVWSSRHPLANGAGAS